MNEKLIKELSKYSFTKKKELKGNEYTTININKDSQYIKESERHYYLCELDELTNTRILLGIFKCVNTIKNILIAGMILGIAGIMLNLFVSK